MKKRKLHSDSAQGRLQNFRFAAALLHPEK
jgi:hypothetical protein